MIEPKRKRKVVQVFEVSPILGLRPQIRKPFPQALCIVCLHFLAAIHEFLPSEATHLGSFKFPCQNQDYEFRGIDSQVNAKPLHTFSQDGFLPEVFVLGEILLYLGMLAVCGLGGS